MFCVRLRFSQLSFRPFLLQAIKRRQKNIVNMPIGNPRPILIIAPCNAVAMSTNLPEQFLCFSGVCATGKNG